MRPGKVSFPPRRIVASRISFGHQHGVLGFRRMRCFMRMPSAPTPWLRRGQSAVPTPASTMLGTSVIVARRISEIGAFWMPHSQRDGLLHRHDCTSPRLSAYSHNQIVIGVLQQLQTFLTQTAGSWRISCRLAGNKRCGRYTSSLTQLESPTSRPTRGTNGRVTVYQPHVRQDRFFRESDKIEQRFLVRSGILTARTAQ